MATRTLPGIGLDVEYRLVVIGPDGGRRIHDRRDLDHAETTLTELAAWLAEGRTPYAAGSEAFLEERLVGRWEPM